MLKKKFWRQNNGFKTQVEKLKVAIIHSERQLMRKLSWFLINGIYFI